MHQEWLEAKPSDGMDILYTGAHTNLMIHSNYFLQIVKHVSLECETMQTSVKCSNDATGKRETPYNRWEPIYIGTNEVQPYHNIPSKYDSLDSLYDTLCQEPTYDERLTWEGRSDKMVQV